MAQGPEQDRGGTDDAGDRWEALWGRRLAALCVDWFAAVVVARTLTGEWGGLWPLLVLAIEQVLLVGTLGYGLGHRLLGLVVRRRDLRPAGLLPAAVRTALLLLVLPAVLTAPDGRGFHDVAAGTVVLRRRPAGAAPPAPRRTPG